MPADFFSALSISNSCRTFCNNLPSIFPIINPMRRIMIAITILVNIPENNLSKVVIPFSMTEVSFTIDCGGRNIFYKCFLNGKEF